MSEEKLPKPGDTIHCGGHPHQVLQVGLWTTHTGTRRFRLLLQDPDGSTFVLMAWRLRGDWTLERQPARERPRRRAA
jgi:hypothetical protein